jgi:hypothetical protein
MTTTMISYPFPEETKVVLWLRSIREQEGEVVPRCVMYRWGGEGEGDHPPSSITEVYLRFFDSLFQGTGTIFIGSLVKGEYCSSGKSTLFLHDCTLLKGNPVPKNTILAKKIRMIYDILKNEYVYDSTLNPFYIQTRPFYPWSLLSHLKEEYGISVYEIWDEQSNVTKERI